METSHPKDTEAQEPQEEWEAGKDYHSVRSPDGRGGRRRSGVSAPRLDCH